MKKIISSAISICHTRFFKPEIMIRLGGISAPETELISRMETGASISRSISLDPIIVVFFSHCIRGKFRVLRVNEGLKGKMVVQVTELVI